jgi:hypothetical protein
MPNTKVSKLYKQQLKTNRINYKVRCFDKLKSAEPISNLGYSGVSRRVTATQANGSYPTSRLTRAKAQELGY